jgi:hypothetical protein
MMWITSSGANARHRARNYLGAVAAAAFVALAGNASASATTVDYDVSAVTNGLGKGSPVNVVLGPGSYSLTAIGTADGGLYNAWNANSQPDCQRNCSTGWQWGYTYFSAPNVLTLIGVAGQSATDLDALDAVQASPTFNFGTFNITTSTFTPGAVGNPFTFTLDQTSTFGVFIVDGDGDYAHNLGGVSFRITRVPEPATWAMMLLGFVGIGAAMRRRPSTQKVFAQIA